MAVTKAEDARVIEGSCACPGLNLHLFKFMPTDTLSAEVETSQQRFERILAQAPLKALKAIFGHVCSDWAMLQAGVLAANSLEELLTRLGYRLNLTIQIHVQDAYSRLGPEGGIKAVLPYYDIPTQSSFPTLVNFERELTTTPKGAAFFNARLGELKRQLSGLK